LLKFLNYITLLWKCMW